MGRKLFNPSIAAKIRTMHHQVRWRDPIILQQGIDQTRVALNDIHQASSAFSFFVIGDTDVGAERDLSLQEHIASNLVSQQSGQFILHMGDVGYPFGTSEFYLKDFIAPYYKHSIVHLTGDRHSHDLATFNIPFFPVPGNHDYYDLPFLQRVLSQLTEPLQQWLQSVLGWKINRYHSGQGRAYADLFLDRLYHFQNPDHLADYLRRHYTAHGVNGTCLNYQPSVFTRLPNRYYSFHYGGIDFFAIDSNTLTEFHSKSASSHLSDQEQLNWLKNSLIDSWNDPTVRGRICYLHHSPYTTETLHCEQPQIMAVRRNLRRVLDQVAIAVNSQHRPLVDLILGGHAHCLEYLQTLDTGYADSHLNWIVCGGSGMSLRHQRRGMSEVMEMNSTEGQYIRTVARSHLFVGRQGHGARERRLHTFLRIDVQTNPSLQLLIQPFVIEQHRDQWHTSSIQSFRLELPNRNG